MKIGDSVVVKQGIRCPDAEQFHIGGWQGRISEITEDEEGNVLVSIQWDSLTLKNMPDSFIEQSEAEGLDYTNMRLYAAEVELTKPRDRKEDIARAVKEISVAHSWSWLGEEGRRIQRVLSGIDEENEMAVLKAWESHLESVLSFPFEAEVSEYQERGQLQSGDKVCVERISIVDDLYGIIVELRLGRKKYDFPLSDLEVIDRKSPNFQHVKDYCVWFANS